MSEHTPTPWFPSGKVIYGATPEDGLIGGCHDSIDTEFVCRAVNAHDALLEACKVAEECVNGLMMDYLNTPNPQEVIEQIKKAIALAEEGEDVTT